MRAAMRAAALCADPAHTCTSLFEMAGATSQNEPASAQGSEHEPMDAAGAPEALQLADGSAAINAQTPASPARPAAAGNAKRPHALDAASADMLALRNLAAAASADASKLVVEPGDLETKPLSKAASHPAPCTQSTLPSEVPPSGAACSLRKKCSVPRAQQKATPGFARARSHPSPRASKWRLPNAVATQVAEPAGSQGMLGSAACRNAWVAAQKRVRSDAAQDADSGDQCAPRRRALFRQECALCRGKQRSHPCICDVYQGSPCSQPSDDLTGLRQHLGAFVGVEI